MNIRLNPPPFVALSATKTFILKGNSFFDIRSIYLSGYPYENLTFYNSFSANNRLSAQNPGFYGLKLESSQYFFTGTNTLTLTIPPPTRLGFIDIILENEGGWGNLTKFAKTTTFNPYPNEHPLKNSWTPYIKPWKMGIEVIDNYL